MGVENRPYVGTWQISRQQVVQHTPDALVYINGDTTVPGCPKCNGRIDLQEFITEVSVDAGTDPGGASASFTLSIPLHHTDSFARDAKFILRPGLEVHIYMRGFFPTKGMYASLAEPAVSDSDVLEGLSPEAEEAARDQVNPKAAAKTAEKRAHETETNLPTSAELNAALDQTDGLPGTDSRHDYIYSITGGEEPARDIADYSYQLYQLAEVEESLMASSYPQDRMIGIAEAVETESGVPGAWIWGIMTAESDGQVDGLGTGDEFGMGQMTREQFEQAKSNDATRAQQEGNSPRITWRHSDNIDPQYASWSVGGVLWGVSSAHRNPDQEVSLSEVVDYWLATKNKTLSPVDRLNFIEKVQDGAKKYDARIVGGQARKALVEGDTLPPLSPLQAKANRNRLAYAIALKEKQERVRQRRSLEPEGKSVIQEESEVLPPSLTGSGSLLERTGLQGSGVEDVIAYPYYHVFHGVVTQISHSWSGGVNTVSVQCASMLHFWQYHTISTNASVFGARSKNSKLKTSMVGHNFTGMHPYQIIWTLFNDMVGAAGGVGWALSQKTNQTAKSEILGESLFSLNIRYWKRRFDTEMIKLRLHGASGELFSTAQAAFLGQTSSAKLTRLLNNRFTDPSSRQKKDSLRGLLEQSRAVGLFNDRRLESLRFGLSRPTSKNSPQFELNLAEMQAFVSNVSNWGQLQLFESTYESKLDIAQRVTEVIGFEFFQDVDGDFVFKPPLYNMDTSDSRVYRIEDIDIISISFEEKEPEVTYMTVKGSQGKNIEFGVDGEWGHRGQYIDYRLVAKFGWRPADYETAYFNDSKSMFFSAVNRMDILNAPANSASVTIPIRPEMRVGYPVYISYLDCYYYCNSFSHSFSVGGECTTSLQLVGKRSKFYAPGRVGTSAPLGIDAIDLSNTILPERPLQVLDQNGRPRLSGFPNVVMALDPDDINELFFVVGNDIENIGDPRILKSLLKKGRDLGILSYNSTRGTYRMKVEVGEGEKGQKKTQWVEFFLQDPDLPVESPSVQEVTKSKGSSTTSSSPIDIIDAAAKYQQKQEDTTRQIERLQKQIFEIDQKILDLQIKQRDIQLANHKASESQRKKNASKSSQITQQIEGPSGLESKKAKLLAAIDTKQVEFDKKIRASDGSGVDHLISLFKTVGQEFIAQNSDVADLDSTVNLLDMLSDKKATFSNGTQPGSYRYYSCSHPDPEQQGQALVRYNQTATGGREVQKRNPLLAPQWQGVEVDGYLPSSQVTSLYLGGLRPEAQIGKIKPQRGIRVLTGNKTLPKGEVIPTSEIRELSFSVQEASVLKGRASRERLSTISNLSFQARKSIGSKFTLGAIKSPTNSSFLTSASPRSLFSKVWDGLVQQVGQAERAANNVLLTPTKKGQVTSKVPPKYPDIAFPSEIPVGGSIVSTDGVFGDFKFKDTTATNPWGPSGSGGQTIAIGANRAGNGLANVFFDQLNRTRKVWVSKLGQAGFRSKQVEQATGAFNSALQGMLGVPAGGKVEQRTTRTRRKNVDIFSPVFPVSDSRGYEVVGSYRYGRDVSIEPQNIFQGIHYQDPLSFLDKQDVVNVLNAFVRKKGRVRGVPQVDPKTGKVVKDNKGNPKILNISANNPIAQNSLEQHLLGQLRKNLTNKQIIDLFGMDTDDPTSLENGLRNWITDKLKDGIHKVPVINAAFSLADLHNRQDKRVCSCKGAEADVLLEAFSEQDFVQFTAPGDRLPVGYGSGEMDQATQYVTHLTARASASWSQSQDALRGAVLDRGGSPLLTSGKSALEQLTEGEARRRNAVSAVSSTIDDLGDL